MRVIVAGGRNFTDFQLLCDVLNTADIDVGINCVVSGAARGADTLGKQWAEAGEIRVEEFPADWEQHGQSAGFKRNVEMAAYSDALIAFWDWNSRGTRHMIDIALAEGLWVKVVRY